MKRTLTLLLVSAAAAVGLTSVYVNPAFANWEGSCTKCDAINGPNESVNSVAAENLSGKGVCVLLWKWNGGTNYNLEHETCSPEGSGASILWNTTIPGHGEGWAYFQQFTYTLKLFQWVR